MTTQDAEVFEQAVRDWGNLNRSPTVRVMAEVEDASAQRAVARIPRDGYSKPPVLYLRRAPEDVTLRIDASEHRGDLYVVGAPQVRHVAVLCGFQTKRLVMTDLRSTTVRLNRSDERSDELAFTSSAVEKFALRGPGGFQLQTVDDAAIRTLPREATTDQGTTRLSLRNCSLGIPRKEELPCVEAHDEVDALGAGLVVERLVTSPNVRLGGEEWRIRELVVQGDVIVSAKLQVREVVGDATFQLAKGNVSLRCHSQQSKPPTFTGDGDVTIRGPLDSPRFMPTPDGKLSLTLDAGVQVLEATGAVALRALSGATLVGRRDGDRLSITELVRGSTRGGGATDAFQSGGIEDVEVDRLRPGDLALLESLERFSPFPIPVGVKAIQPAGGFWQTLGRGLRWYFDPPKEQLGGRAKAARQAKFATDIADLAARKGARGSRQAELRWTATEARRLAESFARRREWWILCLYRLLGYGEKISRPLAVWATVTSMVLLVAALLSPSVPDPDHAGGAVASLAAEWLKLAATAFVVRFAEVRPIEQVSDGLRWPLLLVQQVVATLSLVFALLAARRVARAE